MKCVVCRHGVTRAGVTTVAFHEGRWTLVVNEVPAEVCENCGEAYIAEEVTSRLLEMANEARRTKVQVLVRDYDPVAA